MRDVLEVVAYAAVIIAATLMSVTSLYGLRAIRASRQRLERSVDTADRMLAEMDDDGERAR